MARTKKHTFQIDRKGLDKIYERAHEYLKDIDNRRDQILAFYAVIVGLYLGLLKEISQSPKGLLVVFSLVMFVFSLLIGYVLFLYRRWHIVYTQTVEVAKYWLFSDGEPVKKEDLAKAFEWVDQIEKSNKVSWWRRAENVVLVAFVVLSLPIFFIAVTRFFQASLFCMLILFMVYIILWCIFYYWRHKSEEPRDAKEWVDRNWLIRLPNKNEDENEE